MSLLAELLQSDARRIGAATPATPATQTRVEMLCVHESSKSSNCSKGADARESVCELRAGAVLRVIDGRPQALAPARVIVDCTVAGYQTFIVHGAPGESFERIEHDLRAQYGPRLRSVTVHA